MGLATGDLVFGTIGAPDARSFTVIGDTVNLASRLEGANNAGPDSNFQSGSAHPLMRPRRIASTN